MHIITGNVAPKELDAMENTSDVQMSAPAVNQQILRLRSAKLIATNPYAGLSAEVRQTILSLFLSPPFNLSSLVI